MKSRVKKSCAIISSVFLLIAVCAFVITCTNPVDPKSMGDENNSGEITDTQDGSTRLVVAIHDTPFKKDSKFEDFHKDWPPSSFE